MAWGKGSQWFCKEELTSLDILMRPALTGPPPVPDSPKTVILNRIIFIFYGAYFPATGLPGGQQTLAAGYHPAWARQGRAPRGARRRR